jgi:hypothetical protein
MIIKVPVYVELIGKVDQSTLQEKVKMLEEAFYKVVRKHNFSKANPFVPTAFFKEEDPDFKIVSREQALEYLRTKK